METVTQRSAASAEESAAASEELATQAQALQDVVERMRQLVGGNSDGTSRTDGTRRRSAPLAPASSHSADLSALSHSLHKADRARAAAPAAMPASSHGVEAFPLDETESNF
jgi:hypothetical protein